MSAVEGGSPVRADELMSSPVVAVTSDHSVAAAWEAMRSRGVHHLVVLDEFGLSAVLDARTLAAHWPSGGPEAARSCRVREIVVHGVHCVRPDQSAGEVARVMVSGRCDAVPVVTGSGVLLGLVTASDLVAAVARGILPTARPPGPARGDG